MTMMTEGGADPTLTLEGKDDSVGDGDERAVQGNSALGSLDEAFAGATGPLGLSADGKSNDKFKQIWMDV